MRRVVWALLLAVAFLFGMLSLTVLWNDAMIHFHFLYVDYPNPNGHGLKGRIVTLPELTVVFVKTGALLGIALYCFEKLIPGELGRLARRCFPLRRLHRQ